MCAVMLTKDRTEMAKQAIECFRRQTYQNKRLLIVNSGGWPILDKEPENEIEPVFVGADALTIGALRNLGCLYATGEGKIPDIYMHLDDDDYSHPNRIAEQVALLQSSGADCVGYREMLFWHETGMTYLYTNTDPTYCLGTSLCYWREAWRKNPFSERNGPNPRERGEDREFLRGINSVGVSSFAERLWTAPRMIARIHAGNAAHYPVDQLALTSSNWLRVPEWDERVREIMEAKCPSGT